MVGKDCFSGVFITYNLKLSFKQRSLTRDHLEQNIGFVRNDRVV